MMNLFENEDYYKSDTFENTQKTPNIIAPELVPTTNENDEVLVMREDFNFDGFQVVRKEFFAHLREPAITFNNCKFYVNAACLSKFPNIEYAQILINSKNKILALRPCYENTRDSFKWCNTALDGKRKSRQVTGRMFFAMIVTLMGWDRNNRYKILGNLIQSNNEYLLAFDLTSTEVYKMTSEEGEKRRLSRIPAYPADWKDQFGVPYLEHKESMKINIVDGYAVYSIKDSDHKAENSNLLEPVAGDDDMQLTNAATQEDNTL